MDKYIVFKNALVATMDEQNRAGVFNIIIKNDKIYDIDYENRLNNEEVIKSIYPKSEIIDLKNKLVVPPFINSHFCSSYSLSKVFFKRFNYDTINYNISLNLINKYFTNPKLRNDLRNLFKINYSKSLSNGEFIINETSSFISKEYFLEDKLTGVPFGQEVLLSSYDTYLNSYLWNNNRFHFISLKYDEEINNYSLSFLKKSFSKEKNKIFLENLKSGKTAEEVNRNFGKSFVKVLDDYDLLSSDLILSNPVFLSRNDLEILSEKEVNVVLCLTDLVNLTENNINLNDFFNSDVNVCIGTGYLGENVLSELNILSRFINLNEVPYEYLYRAVTTNPYKIFDKLGYNITIEKGNFANFVIFDLSDIRNVFDFPEYDMNYILQHVIESLDTKDICDLIIKGNYLIRDYQNKFFEQESLRKNIKELTTTLYNTGKYFELKEKYLMKKRIKKLSNREEEKERLIDNLDYESNIELIDNPKMISDSDFKVIGAKINENLIMSSDIISPDDNVFKNINEVSSLDFGLSIYGNEDDITEKHYPDIEKSIPVVKENVVIDKSKLSKVFFDDIKNTSKSDKPDDEKKTEPVPRSKKEIKFLKSKLKFGFNEEENK